MERPSVQAPDTFYPEAGSHMPLYAAAVKNQRGPSFPCSALFLRGKAFIRPAPAPTTEVLKNMEERLILLFVCGTVHLPGSAPPAFSSPSLQPLFIMGEKPEFAQKKRHASVQSRINSRAFVRLFLTLGKNTLDYLSRINK